MLEKEAIFKDIQRIMQADYAGYIDKKNINNPEQYNVSNDMSNREFTEVIQDYLLDFKDGHLWFLEKNSTLPNRGFSVRRYTDTLYVTSTPQEKTLSVADEIIQIDGQEIPKLAIKYRKRLEEELPERQRWNALLQKATNILVKRGQDTFKYTLSDYKPESYQATHDFKLLDDGETGYMQLTDFAVGEPIQEIIQQKQQELREIKNLIIDVRVNNGGNDLFYFPILPYIFDQQLYFSDLFAEDEVMYTNFTKANCQLMIQTLEKYMEQELDLSTVERLKEDIEIFKKNDGKGLLEVSDDIYFKIEGSSDPENIYVLTDYFCGSSGETFVSNVKKSPKVTVVGRATMGIMDYFNVVTIDYGDFEFIYSISKMNNNYLTNGKGVAPDIYIPWTPEHLKTDVDLAYVKELIKNKRNH